MRTALLLLALLLPLAAPAQEDSRLKSLRGAASIEALTVAVDEETTQALVEDWRQREMPIPLRVVASPYREITRPIIDYVKSVRRESPRDLVAVYIPQFIVGSRWEQLLHNQSALRLRARLMYQQNVTIVSVPWQLSSLERIASRPEHDSAGAVRRGFPEAEVEEREVAKQFGVQS